MDKKERKEKLQNALIDQFYEIAKTQAHSEFTFIRSMDGMYAAKAFKKIFKKAVALFSIIKRNAFKNYHSLIRKKKYLLGFEEILVISEADSCLDYYIKEIDMLKSELKEFRSYLNAGNWLKCILGYTRSEDELFNYLEAPIKSIEDE